MGLSANQARLLTLTARVHDLELSSMVLSAQKMNLAMRNYSLAVNYSQRIGAINDQYNPLINEAKNNIGNGGSGVNPFGGSGNGTGIGGGSDNGTTANGYYTTTWSTVHRTDVLEFNYKNLLECGYTLTDNRTKPEGSTGAGLGKVEAKDVTVPKNKSEMINIMLEYGIISGDPEVSGDDVYYTAETDINLGSSYKEASAGGKISMNEMARYFCRNRDTSDNAFQYTLDKGVWGEYVATAHNNSLSSNSTNTLTPISQLSSTELRDEIVAGNIIMKDSNGTQYTGSNVPTQLVHEYDEEVPTTTFVPAGDGGSGNGGSGSGSTGGGSYDGGSYYGGGYYDDDGTNALNDLKDEKRDALDKLEREYEIAMKKITMEEKVIDMMMNQNNTELQACNTEMESVKSLIDKTVERDFTLFG